MLLEDLIKKLDYDIINGSINVEVNNLIYDSRKIVEGDVFVCITGAVSDGHSYIDEVVDKGALALIVERDIDIKAEYGNVTIVKVPDTRYALALMSAAYFGYPAEKLFTIGITGTKGKTTTSYMVRNILEACNIKTGLIGTIETIIGDEHIKSSNTTPESYMIQYYFDKMVKAGCKCVVMEVSSQALMLHRTAGIMFDIGVFTNLEPDHIGPNEHASFEEYLQCKSLLFKQCVTGIVNIDDEHTEKVTENCTCKLETYGFGEKALFRATDVTYENKGGTIATTYKLGDMQVELLMPGKFSVYNSMCAIAVTRHLNVEESLLKKALKEVRVAGRVETVNVYSDYIVLIDYAHNAMSLMSLLTTLKEYDPTRIVCLFGCGGNRSKLRRYEMGEISGKMADYTIITSDNPRFEEPEDIMNDIETGIKKTTGEYIKIPDRGEAVKYALQNAKAGDIIVLAGKGHEDYQEIKGVKYHQTDRELVEKAVESLR